MSLDGPDWGIPTIGPNSLPSSYERRSTIYNDNRVEAPNAPPAFVSDPGYIGKFYTRGMRGMLNRIEVYCRRTTPIPQIFLAVTPHPGLGPVKWGILTPGVEWGWYGIDIDEMWNYDSMFIYAYYVVTTDIGYDTLQLYDAHISDDAGATWTEQQRRYYVRAIVSGETPGDVPVSGIVNTIRIPNWTPQQLGFTNRTVDAGGEESIGSIGVGTLLTAMWHVRSDAARDALAPYIDLDGQRVQPNGVSMQDLHTYIDNGDDKETWTWPRWDEVNHYYTLQLTLPLPFHREVRIGAENTSIGAQDIRLYGIFTRLR